MLVAIVLGNRINNDGSMSKIMLNRLKIAVKVYNTFAPHRIVLAGGAANKKIDMTEARMMYEYLIAQGIPNNVIIIEEASLTTKQNAEFSIPLAIDAGATELLLCTSIDHMVRGYLNPIKLFQKQLANYHQIKLSVYCE